MRCGTLEHWSDCLLAATWLTALASAADAVVPQPEAGVARAVDSAPGMVTIAEIER